MGWAAHAAQQARCHTAAVFLKRALRRRQQPSGARRAQRKHARAVAPGAAPCRAARAAARDTYRAGRRTPPCMHMVVGVAEDHKGLGRGSAVAARAEQSRADPSKEKTALSASIPLLTRPRSRLQSGQQRRQRRCCCCWRSSPWLLQAWLFFFQGRRDSSNRTGQSEGAIYMRCCAVAYDTAACHSDRVKHRSRVRCADGGRGAE